MPRTQDVFELAGDIAVLLDGGGKEIVAKAQDGEFFRSASDVPDSARLVGVEIVKPELIAAREKQ